MIGEYTLIEYPSNALLEEAALAAEHWQEHGEKRCKNSWLNTDGFL